MKRTTLKRCLHLMSTLGVIATVYSFNAPEADAAVCYDQYGRQYVVDPYALTTSYNCYNSTGVVVVVRPLAPAVVGRPAYGAAGVRGTARRTSRRTSRRVNRRH